MVLCVACQVDIPVENQRDHFRTEWHCYNLKRKMAQLPPISAVDFEEKVFLIKEKKQLEVDSNKSFHCTTCKKKFNKQKAFEQHLASNTHIKQLACDKSRKDSTSSTTIKQNDGEVIASQAEKQQQSVASKMDISNDENEADDDEEEWCDADPLGLEECLFCSHISKTLEANISHMARVHSFFLPEAEFLEDTEGLITYLDEKVGVGSICLWCQREFASTRSVQQHMLDKGHSKLFCDGEAALEFADFYDFSSSYPDADKSSADDLVDMSNLDGEGYELRLPSGAVLGHRLLWRYFKQSLPPERQVSLYSGNNRQTKATRLASQYRALGWSGGLQAQAKRTTDMAYIQRQKSKAFMKLGVAGNKLQKHFRAQVMF